MTVTLWSSPGIVWVSLWAGWVGNLTPTAAKRLGWGRGELGRWCCLCFSAISLHLAASLHPAENWWFHLHYMLFKAPWLVVGSWNVTGWEPNLFLAILGSVGDHFLSTSMYYLRSLWLVNLPPTQRSRMLLDRIGDLEHIFPLCCKTAYLIFPPMCVCVYFKFIDLDFSLFYYYKSA